MFLPYIPHDITDMKIQSLEEKHLMLDKPHVARFILRKDL